MKLGLILECQFDGPDEKVFRCLLRKFAGAIEVQTATQGNKINLVRDCGTAARQLLADGCDHVVIVWDLYPAEWGDALQQKDRTPCLHNDCEKIHAALRTAEVNLAQVSLVAVEFMLESWLLADKRALALFLSQELRREISAQQIGSPDPAREKRPKDVLSKMFERLDLRRPYRDNVHAVKIATQVSDLTQLKRCPSFTRFWNKAVEERDIAG
jgi:hypothetical protein